MPTDPRFSTSDQVADASPYDLARRLTDRLDRQGTSVDDYIDDLVTMAGLRARLADHLPSAIHRAVAEGATVEQVCAATGMTVAEAAEAWRTWISDERLDPLDPYTRHHQAQRRRIDDAFAEAARKGPRRAN